MAPIEQLTPQAGGHGVAGVPCAVDRDGWAHVAEGELAARRTLRAQVGRLEHQLSSVVASGFPHVQPLDRGASMDGGGPRMLSLGELECLRDRLAAALERACRQAEERAELVRRSRALLEDMKREPARHKLVRLPVVDLGEGSCGVWQVRPRLGLIGMLAGWWQVKLSSGCP